MVTIQKSNPYLISRGIFFLKNVLYIYSMRNLVKQIGNFTWEDSFNEEHSGMLLTITCDDFIENYLIPKKYLLTFKKYFPEYNLTVRDKSNTLDKAILNTELSKEEVLISWEDLKSTIEDFKKKADARE